MQVATVTQLRTAVKQEPRPEPESKPEPKRKISKIEGEDSTTWRITLPKVEAAKFEAGLQSHRDGLIADWKRDHDTADSIDPEDGGTRQYDAESQVSEQAPAVPGRGGCVHESASRPAGTPRWRPARTGSTPPWWCMSMSRNRSQPCISDRH